MKRITRYEVPRYLQHGHSFHNLPATIQTFEVPSDCLKANLTIKTDQDLDHLLRSVLFWRLFETPKEVFEYIMDKAWNEWHSVAGRTKAQLTKVFRKFAAENKTFRSLIQSVHEQLGAPLEHDWWAVPALLTNVPNIANYFVLEQDPQIAKTLTCATYVESMKCMQLARLQGWTFRITIYEPANQHRLRWIQRECETVEAMERAAGSGHLGLLRHLWEENCPWDERVCAAAAAGGHLRCLAYAHYRGCPWDRRTIVNALENLHFECLGFAYEHDCPNPYPWRALIRKRVKPFVIALIYRLHAVFDWLYVLRQRICEIWKSILWSLRHAFQLQ